jgi:hypothetical protein
MSSVGVPAEPMASMAMSAGAERGCGGAEPVAAIAPLVRPGASMRASAAPGAPAGHAFCAAVAVTSVSWADGTDLGGLVMVCLIVLVAAVFAVAGLRRVGWIRLATAALRPGRATRTFWPQTPALARLCVLRM